MSVFQKIFSLSWKSQNKGKKSHQSERKIKKEILLLCIFNGKKIGLVHRFDSFCYFSNLICLLVWNRWMDRKTGKLLSWNILMTVMTMKNAGFTEREFLCNGIFSTLILFFGSNIHLREHLLKHRKTKEKKNNEKTQ